MACSDNTGRPCRCNRLMVKCRRCRRDVSISHGEFAPAINKYDYTCARCGGRRDGR